MLLNVLYKMVPHEVTHLCRQKNVYTLCRSVIILNPHMCNKKLEIDTALIVCQILNDAFKIQIHSKSSEF